MDVFGGGKQAVESLTVDLGKDWDIVQFLAIKLWPGAHPFSGTVEAAVDAARDANVPPQEVAKILVAGPNRTTIGGSRRPKDLVEAIHSLPDFVASAVADKDFTWVHATEARSSTLSWRSSWISLKSTPPHRPSLTTGAGVEP